MFFFLGTCENTQHGGGGQSTGYVFSSWEHVKMKIRSMGGGEGGKGRVRAMF